MSKRKGGKNGGTRNFDSRCAAKKKRKGGKGKRDAGFRQKP